ncbi:hypothetical protein IIE26_27170 (plasmid) [Cytobacillus oceanisediminis]|uniref:hypothetical protein n=1 Tax=Cytobacillus oceanisediminis TaxID=665099 RepID=UPI001863C5FF|nr:hypothetical protein [Cytobacillus oceanisediminis]QOK30052.1 hypothetical protein IIE26_27170 [Cytobacillus oceanisediminis]
MLQIICVLSCLFLLSLSLLTFSKSAEQRARLRTELYYAMQIREETEAIRLHNEKIKMENNLELISENNKTIEDISPEPIAHEVLQIPVKEIKLKEVDLDEKSKDFISNFQPMQEEIPLQDVTVYESVESWFNFPEVDLHMNERPEKGLYYVAGKVIDILDEMSAIISDGTGERMLYHHKVQNLSVGDIIIAQVEVHKRVWNFVKVWEINEETEYEVEEAI